ncbi:MAG TPA: type II toxin-antitoxin system VapC family toxin [Candidatus Latescibacteria bacterium]|nr:PIN domain nuclease [Gemmatimonadota bacterium]MDP7634491.1 type II toxin-antitoxin system VapC family toxin [Candidatus Latescibacterota bacterium]HJN29314.1 type II toxin-antitoxin system VapC family toxin [Candidatus Latescibacterota bacterium]|tara:strand:- start:624 stop:1052 length:429 start_codon:yes stop_codon:yes gene_type:complete
MAERRMAYLLDTHIWIWWMIGADPLRSSPARERIARAIDEESARVSVISVWEVGMLEAHKRISLTVDVETWTRQALSSPGLSLAPLTPDIALASSRLPGEIHGDPADRMLIATARSLGATLVTRDRRILEYSQAGHVTTLAV